MGIFGENLYAAKKKIRCPFTFSDNKSNKEPTLAEMAEEKFGSDRRLILHLTTFLSECRKKRQLPTRLSWAMQLKLLEKFPEEERVKQVTSSIMKGYRAIAYEGNLEKCKHISNQKEKEEDIVRDLAY